MYSQKPYVVLVASIPVMTALIITTTTTVTMTTMISTRTTLIQIRCRGIRVRTTENIITRLRETSLRSSTILRSL